MNTPLELRPGRLYLILAPRAMARSMMNTFTARLAQAGSVRVLDAGNSFDALTIARQIRSQTQQLDACLERIRVARAFTCYQVVTLLRQQPASKQPVLVLDLLSTFADESVALDERMRLLGQVIDELQRLSSQAPVAVSAILWASQPSDLHQPYQHPGRFTTPLPAMVERLEDAASQVLRFINPESPQQGRLW